MIVSVLHIFRGERHPHFEEMNNARVNVSVCVMIQEKRL